MRYLLSLLLASVSFAAVAPVQRQSLGSTLPSTCSQGQMFQLLTVLVKHEIYYCSATNVWTQQNADEGEVSAADFGAVGDSVTDNQPALQAMLNYAAANNVSVHIPAGIYIVKGRLHSTRATYIHGDGDQQTCLVEADPISDLFVVDESAGAYMGSAGGGWSPGPAVSNMCFAGEGTYTTGVLFTNNSSGRFVGDHVTFMAHNVIALQDNTERSSWTNVNITSVKEPYITNENSAKNESYISNFLIMDPGWVANELQLGPNLTQKYCWSDSATAGAYPSSGVVQQTQHAAIALGNNVVNFHIMNGSIKSTLCQAGIRVRSGSEVSVEHVYFEGYWNGAVNPSVIQGGTHERTTLTSAISTSAMQFDIANGAWFGYNSTASDLNMNNGFPFVVYPPDFVAGSTTASSLGNGILQGDYEYMEFRGILHDATGSGWHAIVTARGYGGTTAKAWPSGAMFSEAWDGQRTDGTRVDPGLWYAGLIRLADNHYGSFNAGNSGYTLTCNQNSQQTCGEIITGDVPDQFFQLGSNQLHSPGWGVQFIGSSEMFCGTARSGSIDVYGVANIDVSQSSFQITSMLDSDSGQGYGNGNTVPMNGISACGGAVRETGFPNNYNAQINYVDKFEQMQYYGTSASPVIAGYAITANNPALNNTAAMTVPPNNHFEVLGYNSAGTGPMGTNAPWRYDFSQFSLAGIFNGSQTWSINNFGEAAFNDDVQALFYSAPDQSSTPFYWSYEPYQWDLFYFANHGTNWCVAYARDQAGNRDNYCIPMQVPQIVSTVSPGAAPVINLSYPNIYQSLTLNGNVTGANFSNWGTGQTYTVAICQPTTGGPYTFAWPGSVVNAPTVTSTAGQCTVVSMVAAPTPGATGNSLYVVGSSTVTSGGGGGGSGTPASIQNTGYGVQVDATSTSTNVVLDTTRVPDTSANATLLDAQRAKVIYYTAPSGGLSIAVPGAGVGGLFINGWWAKVCNNGTGVLTLSAGSSQFWNGGSSSTVTVAAGHRVEIDSTGSAWNISGGEACTGTSF